MPVLRERNKLYFLAENDQEGRPPQTPAASSSSNDLVTRLPLPTQRTPAGPRAETSTSEASTSGTSSVTEEDDDESDVSPRSWFWLRRQSRRSRQHLRLAAASHKRARIDLR